MSSITKTKAKAKPYRCPKELDILPPRPVLFPWIPSMPAECGLKFDCCGGGTTTSNSNDTSNEASNAIDESNTDQKNGTRFSFDDSAKGVGVTALLEFEANSNSSGKANEGKTAVSSSSPGTPATLPLSPSELSTLSVDSDGYENYNDNDSTELSMPDLDDADVSSLATFPITEPRGSFGIQVGGNRKKLVSLETIITEVFRVIFFFMSMKRGFLKGGDVESGRDRKRLVGVPLGNDSEHRAVLR